MTHKITTAILLTLITLAGCVNTKEVRYPEPIPVTNAKEKVPDFILASAATKAVILIGDPDPPKYQFPYWGGEAILRRYLQVITGIDVPIMDYRKFEADPQLNTPDTYRIWVGKQPKVEAAIGADLAKIDDDGFIIKAVGGHDLFISGKHYWGTHWAPYDLLERAADCRWYLMPPIFWKPKEDGMVGLGDILPKASEVKLPGNAFIVEQPSYRSRYFRIAPPHSYRLRQRDKFSHNLVNIFPPEKYGKTHPEYYPWINGKRQVPEKGHEQEFQPCVSNPDTIEIAVQAASEAFDQGASCFSLGMNDSGKFCECAKCLAIAPASITNKQARIAYAFFDWYNQIAERLEKKYPDKRLGCLAYAGLNALPEGVIKLNPMIVPYLTRDSAQLFDPNEVTEFRETVDKWSKLATRMGIYEYIYGQGFYIPRIYNRYILANIKNHYGVGCDGFYAEAYPQWALDGPKYWFIDKLLWNSNYPIEDLYNDYYNHMFGPAAKEMRAYFDYLEEVWCTQTLKSSRSNYRWMLDPKQFEIFTPEKCEHAIALIDAAAVKAKADADVLKRIAFFRDGIEFTRQMSARYNYANQLTTLLQTPGELPVPQVSAALESWLRGGTMRDLFLLKNKIGLDQTSHVSLEGFSYEWNRNPAPSEAIYRLATWVATEARKQPTATAPTGYQQAVDQIVAAHRDSQSTHAWTVIADIAQSNAVLFVHSATTAPTLDGVINAAEWGAPVESGLWYLAYEFPERAAHRTTVYAKEIDGKNLYLAFDCEGDPKLIGGDVTGRNTDTAYPRRMAKDDAIAISINQPGVAAWSYCFNVNGAVVASEGVEGQARKTDHGWQLEVRLPIGRLNPNTRFCLSRYERVPTEDGKGVTSACYTLVPVGRVGSIVGHGNFSSLMSFIWGSTLVYEKPANP